MDISPTSPRPARPMASTALGVVTPVSHSAVAGHGVLGRWQARNRRVTLPHGLDRLASAGNLDNLRRVVDGTPRAFRGPVFADSDVYKTLEAVAWELGHEDDAALRAFYDDTVALLQAAQEDDGYLDSAYQRPEAARRPCSDRAAVDARWTDFAFGHELYCAGHLFQAAVAAARSLGDERLLGVATRLADLVVRRFGTPDSPVYPGHPEVESALVELYRLTGLKRYLDVAAAFIDRRGAGWLGAGVFGPAYYQDDAPLRDVAVMRGHAVRALYLNSGATDVYLETGDATLLAALTAQWEDMVTRRSYLTGGTGSRHRDEAFGDAYELPSDRAYAETCAGIAALHWAWRMYVATGQARYADFFETALYNVVADGISEEGDAFFYSNPLQLRADHASVQEEAAARRLDWYRCACCPPNLMRTFASVEGYLAAVHGDELHIVQYTGARVRADVGPATVTVDIDTGYPADGHVRLRVHDDVDRVDAGTLTLRVPGWCRSTRVSLNGVVVDARPSDGWVRLPGALRTGTVVDVDFDITPEILVADERVDVLRGTVAVRRGPIVYCAEQRDNVVDVDALLIDVDGALAETDQTTVLGPIIQVAGYARNDAGARPLYAARNPRDSDDGAAPAVLRLRPYATWGNGAAGGMRTWLPVARMTRKESR